MKSVSKNKENRKMRGMKTLKHWYWDYKNRMTLPGSNFALINKDLNMFKPNMFGGREAGREGRREEEREEGREGEKEAGKKGGRKGGRKIDNR
jgi:hypothetical protein